DSTHGERKTIKSNCKTILGWIYGMQFINLIVAEIHNMNAREYQRFSKNRINIDFGFTNNTEATPQLTLRKRF
ncbi:MAG: hypothetical protein JW983_02955, partial [Elusimicrobia bacterium]|nr:hypothetical protein [Elusimicrobiota bacterium]